MLPAGGCHTTYPYSAVFTHHLLELLAYYDAEHKEHS